MTDPALTHWCRRHRIKPSPIVRMGRRPGGWRRWTWTRTPDGRPILRSECYYLLGWLQVPIDGYARRSTALWALDPLYQLICRSDVELALAGTDINIIALVKLVREKYPP